MGTADPEQNSQLDFAKYAAAHDNMATPEAYGDIKLTIESTGVATLMFDRPADRNAVSGLMIEEIEHALQWCSASKHVRAVVVTGNPEGGAFCAGAQLSKSGELGVAGGGSADAPKTKKPIRRKTNLMTFREGGGDSSLAAINCTKPIICAINGHAVGWGLTFTLCCDMRVVSADAKCGFPFTRRGIVNESMSSWTLPRLIGIGKAKELVLTGRVFKASDAGAMGMEGLFNYIVPSDQVLSKAMELATEIAANTSMLSVALCKNLMDRSDGISIEEAHIHESRALFYVQNVKKDDNREGVKSFMEKREAKFTLDAWDDLPDFMPWWPTTDTGVYGPKQGGGGKARL